MRELNLRVGEDLPPLPLAGEVGLSDPGDGNAEFKYGGSIGPASAAETETSPLRGGDGKPHRDFHHQPNDSDLMQLNVMLFAAAKEAAGTGSICVEVHDSAQAGDVMDALATALPAIADLMPSCRLAINNEYVGRDCHVCADSEVALIPPVSGG
ncbi:MAG: MoaD/ThiS family protein [Pirellulaceae bacterium]